VATNRKILVERRSDIGKMSESNRSNDAQMPVAELIAIIAKGMRKNSAEDG
jgi:hypothetical protein